jgi:ribonuclease E
VVDEDDTMGYDLSRYEVEPDPVEPVAADVADEPAEGEGPESDEDGDDDGLSAVSGRRRSRRGGTRRRTRP